MKEPHLKLKYYVSGTSCLLVGISLFYWYYLQFLSDTLLARVAFTWGLPVPIGGLIAVVCGVVCVMKRSRIAWVYAGLGIAFFVFVYSVLYLLAFNSGLTA